MNNGKMKIVIVDKNEARRNRVKGCMPLYVEAFCENYGDAAKKQIRPEADGRLTDMVIMNADDSKGHGLYMFDWMKNEEPGLGFEKIPVLLLIADEFSDRALEFLELGDAEFYEGELDADKLYSKMMQTFDLMDFGSEPREEPLLYTEEKAMDKVSGLTIKPVGEGTAVKRSIVLSLEEQRRHLALALERGQKRNEQLKEIMLTALRQKEERKAAAQTGFVNAPSQNPVMPQEQFKTPEQFRTLEKFKTSEQFKTPERFRAPGQFRTPQQFVTPVVSPAVIPGKGPSIPAFTLPTSTSVPGLAQIPLPTPYLSQESFKKTIVVVDHDSRSLKTCEMFLQTRYDVIMVETGMRAIDYFVRSRADLLLLNYQMPVLDGQKILSSIRWQPNGKDVPTIFMAEGNFAEAAEKCKLEGVVGVLSKPVSQSVLMQAVEAVFSVRR